MCFEPGYMIMKATGIRSFVETIPDGSVQPKFIQCLEDSTIEEGSSVRLECKVKGQPNPQVEWQVSRSQLCTN